MALVVRLAEPAEVLRLPAIEVAAGLPFRDIGMEAVAEDKPPPVDELMAYQQDGRCLVAVEVDRQGGEAIAGYLITEMVDGCGHIEQVSALPIHRGRGIGRQLIERAELWASEHDLEAMTLTTFVNVPWNGPYYRRLGYRYMEDGLGPELAAIRAAEAANGLDRWPRAAMKKRL